MAGVELRSRSRIRSDFRSCVQLHRSSSRPRIDRYPLALGRRRAAADLFLGTPLVSAQPRADLLHRVRFILGASGWPDRQRRDFTGESIPASGPRTSWTRRILSIADALLVQLEQCVSAFSLRRWRCSLVAPDSRHRPGSFAGGTFCLLPVALHCWTNLFQFSMGRSPDRNWFFIHFPRAVATLANGADVVAGLSIPGYSRAGFTRGFVFAETSLVQTDVDVRRGEAHQR